MRQRISDINACTTAHHWLRFNQCRNLRQLVLLRSFKSVSNKFKCLEPRGAELVENCLPTYYAALLRRRGPHIASHSVRPSVCPSVRPVIVYIRTSVTCFRQPCGRAVSFVLFTCQGPIKYGDLSRTSLLDTTLRRSANLW